MLIKLPGIRAFPVPSPWTFRKDFPGEDFVQKIFGDPRLPGEGMVRVGMSETLNHMDTTFQKQYTA